MGINNIDENNGFNDFLRVCTLNSPGNLSPKIELKSKAFCITVLQVVGKELSVMSFIIMRC
jgi:hypothetical protein